MRHADALSRNVNSIEKDMVLSREIIKEEQEKDACIRYKGMSVFGLTTMECCIAKNQSDSLVLSFRRY